jgi:GT2 family glycosyltransferase
MPNIMIALLKAANSDFRNGDYLSALKKYFLAKKNNHKLASIVDFNMRLAQSRLKKSNLKKNNIEIKLTDEEIKIISIDNGLFSEYYYLENNQDVANSNIDPFEHYITYGWKEKRNPSKYFDTEYYLSKYAIEENPLNDFINKGRKNGYKINRSQEDTIRGEYLLKIFNKENKNEIKNDNMIDILLPIYNGYNFIKPLFDSIFCNTESPYRLLIADDASTDERIIPLIHELIKDRNNIVFITNDKNIGFVKTVNKLQKLTNNHFVILNSDTEVPKDWLSRLMMPILQYDNIATTTPFTNSGTICSFPNYLIDNEIATGLDVNEVDSYFRYVSYEGTHIEIPTGVGFCMGVNKIASDALEMFDEDFGRGYGEENDFCQRAIKLGFVNVHVPNLFVYHKHGGSFSSNEKKNLIDRNLKLLNIKHTNYESDVAKTIQKNELSTLRKIINFQIQSKNKNIILIFDHGLGGGAKFYLNEVIDKITSRNENAILIENINAEELVAASLISGASIETIKTNSLKDLLEFILENFNINQIFANSLVGYNDFFYLLEFLAKKPHNAKITIPIHDYHLICPSYTLINNFGDYCNACDDNEKCKVCLKENDGEFKKFSDCTDIIKWRNSWYRIIEISDEILCFSNASIDIVKKIYPNSINKITLIPHDISNRFRNIYTKNYETGNKLIIGVLGGINKQKGIGIIKSLSDYIDSNMIDAEIVLFGESSEEINNKSFYKTGSYKNTELPNLIEGKNIGIFLIPSIWPETYSYTTDEVMQLGFPLAVFDLGAPAERVRKYHKGLILNSFEPHDILNDIYKFLTNKNRRIQG